MNQTTSVTLKDLYKALKVSPSHVWQLRAQGVVREPEEKGSVSVQMIEDLFLWYEQARGEIPEEAMELLKKAREEAEEPHE